MTTHNIAVWLRQEHDKVRDLSNELQGEVAVVPRANLGAWIQKVRDRFEHFRGHLTKHMALEEREGYLPVVTQHRPTLAPEVDRLLHEHVEVVRIMEDIHHALAELKPEDGLLIRDCCARIGSLLSYVAHHEDLENNLVSAALTQDIGTKD